MVSNRQQPPNWSPHTVLHLVNTMYGIGKEMVRNVRDSPHMAPLLHLQPNLAHHALWEFHREPLCVSHGQSLSCSSPFANSIYLAENVCRPDSQNVVCHKEPIRGQQQAMGGGIRFVKGIVLEKSSSQLAILVACCSRQPTHGSPLTPPTKSGPPPTMGIW